MNHNNYETFAAHESSVERMLLSEMTGLGPPFVDPTGTTCMMGDTAQSFGKAVLWGLQTNREPCRSHCTYSSDMQLETLVFDFLHRPPAGSDAIILIVQN
ncbi:hypothetical protein SVAN01_04910 [Stagonosporopsis vannaccii]|nr:hypothetical protein SVAN01_04910 [Stagonosporopsis vannaccii]